MQTLISLRASMAHTYAAPANLPLNQWALGGWTLREDAAIVDRAGGRMVYRFHARDLDLGRTEVRFRVLVDDAGYGTVFEQRTYQTDPPRRPTGDRRFEIEFVGPGAEGPIPSPSVECLAPH